MSLDDAMAEAEQILATNFIQAMEETYSLLEIELLEYTLEALLNTIIKREETNGITH